MFPHLKERLGNAALDRLDLLVEFSTLGEYGLDEHGAPLALAEQEGAGLPTQFQAAAPVPLLRRGPTEPHCVPAEERRGPTDQRVRGGCSFRSRPTRCDGSTRP